MTRLWCSMACLALGLVGVAGAQDVEPLVLTPQNTVIFGERGYAAPLLQYYLIKFVAGAKDAEKYRPFVEESRGTDRSASEAFPLYETKDAAKLPQGRNIIAVGRTNHLTPADREQLSATKGAMVVRRRGNVVIVAGDPRNPWGAPVSAVRTFLDRCAGVRHYAPEDLWVSRPASSEIKIEALDIFQRPFFAKTAFSYPGKALAARNRCWGIINAPLSTGAQLRASHTIIRYCDPKKYYAAHPEIYEMKGGKRPRPQGTAWNPCLSAKALPQIAMEEVRLLMASKRQPTYLSFGVMDCAFDCDCPECRASVKEHDGSYSNLYYTFMNQVARQCQKEFPGLFLTTYIYSNVRRPPVDMKIEKNIVVDSVIKSYHFVDPAWLRHEMDRIRAFSDLGASWITHDWCFSGVSPRSYMRQYANFLQWAAQNGMVGIYVEWSGDEAWYLDGCKYWILRQLMSNPYQDVDFLWRQYCDDMYGAGGEAMYRLFRHFADKYVYSDQYIRRADIPRQEFCMYTKEDLDYQRALIRKAEALTQGDPLIRERFKLFNRYFRGHELFAEACGEIARIDYRHSVLQKRTDLNKEALAWYVNERGDRITRAIEYYDKQRTLPPDSNGLSTQLGGPPSFINNYSRAMGRILQAIRRQAMQGLDLNRTDQRGVQGVVAACRRVLRQNLPKQHVPARVALFDSMLAKVMWLPTAPTLPRFDGDLSDAVWREAAELKDFTIRDTFRPSRHKSSGKVMRVGDKLVVGLRCDQQGPIWARTPPEIHTGTRIWRESGCEFFFGPVPQAGEKPETAQYIVNALGASRGFRQAKDNRDGVRVAVRQDKQGGYYVIEAAFPLKAKGYDFTKQRVLTFNIMRNIFSRDSFAAEELIGWHPIFYTAQNVESRGLLFTK